ncbi:MAG: hypothetical protein ACRYGF_15395 [Janthinobacterium lividum]
MAQFSYLVTIESSQAPTSEAREAMMAVLAEQGFTELQDDNRRKGGSKFKIAGSSPARADQLAFILRDQLGEVWESTTVLISEPQKLAEE